jgi:hypothetical protein
VVRGFRLPLAAGFDLGLGGGAVRPGFGPDHLAGFEGLVDLEEVLDLEPVELGHVVDVAEVLHPRVVRRDGEHLVVGAVLVGHLEHADDPAGDEAPREGRLIEEYEGVQRVTVLGQGVLDVAVVGGVPGRGEQHPVQPDPSGLVVHLVLVALSLGNFDDNFNVHGFAPDWPG